MNHRTSYISVFSFSIADNKLRDGWDRLQSLNPPAAQKPPSVASEPSLCEGERAKDTVGEASQ